MTLKVITIIPKWRTFKILRWVQLWNRLLYFNIILYAYDAIEDDLDTIFLSRSLNHSKMKDVQISEVAYYRARRTLRHCWLEV
jgi:hypothetical protein